MIDHEADPAAPWHSPQRAWKPLMWIIGAVACALSVMVLAPLAPLVSAVTNGVASPRIVEPSMTLAGTSKALSAPPASPADHPAWPARPASSGASVTLR